MSVLNGMSSRQGDPWWVVTAGIVLTLAMGGCGGADPDGAQSAEPPTKSVTETSPPVEQTTTSAVPTTTELIITAGDLTEAMLSAGEMDLIFQAQGGVAERPPTSIFHVDACGSGSAFAGFTPRASQLGEFQTGTGDIYNAYVGYYPGAAEQVFAATAVPDGCGEFTQTHVDVEGFTPFPVTPATAGEAPEDAPANTRLLGFADGTGGGHQEAFVQLGDFLLVLFYYTDEGSSELEIGSYLGYTLDRFAIFAGEQ